MRRIFFGSVLAIAAALFIGAPATADYYDYELDGSGAPEVGVEYAIGNGVGQLTVLGGAGMSVEAYDVGGAPVAGTVVFDSVETINVPVTGSGALYVRVGDTWYEVSTTDPDWGLE